MPHYKGRFGVRLLDLGLPYGRSAQRVIESPASKGHDAEQRQDASRRVPRR